MKPVESINADQPQNIREEEATQVGKQMGMAVVAAIVNMKFQRYVGASIETMKQTTHYQSFLSALVKEVEEGLASGIPGMRARAHMARHMQAGHVAMRAELHDMSLKEGQKDIPIIDSLLETGDIIDRAVRALLAPIEDNLRELCNQSQQVEAIKRLQFAQQQAQIDHVRDNETCSDPNCDIHKTH